MLKRTYRTAKTALFNLLDWLFKPRPVERSDQEAKRLAKEASCLALYDYKGCSASRRPRREIQRLNIDIECRDFRKCSIHQDKLLAEYGKLRAPCLRIEEKGEVRWLDEPDAIVHFLHERFEINQEPLQELKRA